MEAHLLKSLELLDKYLAETPSEEIQAKIEEYDKMEIEGPTLEEYLNSFNQAFEFITDETPCLDNYAQILEAFKNNKLEALKEFSDSYKHTVKEPSGFVIKDNIPEAGEENYSLAA